jgi:hypothetical protein
MKDVQRALLCDAVISLGLLVPAACEPVKYLTTVV